MLLVLRRIPSLNNTSGNMLLVLAFFLTGGLFMTIFGYTVGQIHLAASESQSAADLAVLSGIKTYGQFSTTLKNNESISGDQEQHIKKTVNITLNENYILGQSIAFWRSKGVVDEPQISPGIYDATGFTETASFNKADNSSARPNAVKVRITFKYLPDFFAFAKFFGFQGFSISKEGIGAFGHRNVVLSLDFSNSMQRGNYPISTQDIDDLRNKGSAACGTPRYPFVPSDENFNRYFKYSATWSEDLTNCLAVDQSSMPNYYPQPFGDVINVFRNDILPKTQLFQRYYRLELQIFNRDATQIIDMTGKNENVQEVIGAMDQALSDWQQWAQVGGVAYYDVDGDGQIGLNDMNKIKNNLGQEHMTQQDGDITGDGKVSIDDFNKIKNGFGLEELWEKIKMKPGGLDPAQDGWTATGLGMLRIGTWGFLPVTQELKTQSKNVAIMVTDGLPTCWIEEVYSRLLDSDSSNDNDTSNTNKTRFFPCHADPNYPQRGLNNQPKEGTTGHKEARILAYRWSNLLKTRYGASVYVIWFGDAVATEDQTLAENFMKKLAWAGLGKEPFNADQLEAMNGLTGQMEADIANYYFKAQQAQNLVAIFDKINEEPPFVLVNEEADE